MKFNLKYFLGFLAIFIIEVFIALFVNDKIIRPYIGDILVIILMYTFIKSFVHKEIKFLPIYLFVIGVFVEITQYFHLADKINLFNKEITSVVIGTSFDIMDIMCYLIGSISLILWEKYKK